MASRHLIFTRVLGRCLCLRARRRGGDAAGKHRPPRRTPREGSGTFAAVFSSSDSTPTQVFSSPSFHEQESVLDSPAAAERPETTTQRQQRTTSSSRGGNMAAAPTERACSVKGTWEHLLPDVRTKPQTLRSETEENQIKLKERRDIEPEPSRQLKCINKITTDQNTA
ncbi:uncharacterized protein V6R79_025829 [Siganus canaliculatus]